jgi:hypothetical protein
MDGESSGWINIRILTLKGTYPALGDPDWEKVHMKYEKEEEMRFPLHEFFPLDLPENL